MEQDRIRINTMGRPPLGRAFLVMALVLGGGYFLWSLLFAESSPSLLWLLLLACPLMHVLMPHGHGNSTSHAERTGGGVPPENELPPTQGGR